MHNSKDSVCKNYYDDGLEGVFLKIPIDKVSGGDEAVFDGIVDNSFSHVDNAVPTDIGECACGYQSLSKENVFGRENSLLCL